MDKCWFVIFFCVITAMIFFFSMDYVLSLMCLFFFTFFSCLLTYMKTHEFWGLGLMLVVMATGLFLVFAYVVSVNPQEPSSSFSWKLKFNSLFMFILMISYYFSDQSLSLPLMANNAWIGLEKEINILFSSSLVVSLHLITLLLFLVIFFMRFTYSKGGSLRKKF